MTIEDYDDVRALWMTIHGFGIRAPVAFTGNSVGNVFRKQISWKRFDVNHYEFVLNEEIITQFIGVDDENA